MERAQLMVRKCVDIVKKAEFHPILLPRHSLHLSCSWITGGGRMCLFIYEPGSVFHGRLRKLQYNSVPCHISLFQQKQRSIGNHPVSLCLFSLTKVLCSVFRLSNREQSYC